jgi:hypothetical protein
MKPTPIYLVEDKGKITLTWEHTGWNQRMYDIKPHEYSIDLTLDQINEITDGRYSNSRYGEWGHIELSYTVLTFTNAKKENREIVILSKNPRVKDLEELRVNITR